MYLSSAEAAKELGVSVQTIYAYVSRGLIRAEETGSRVKRYRWEDIERLKERQDLRQNPGRMVQQSLHWGAPILESALTLIEDGRLYYRGYDAIQLAQTVMLEEVAALIWAGERSLHEEIFKTEALEVPQLNIDHLTLIDMFGITLPLAAAYDYSAYDQRTMSQLQTGARVLKLLVSVAAQVQTVEEDLVTTLAQGWGIEHEAGRHLLKATLILCADHELNVSSFTARCVASAGTTLYGVVTAGLAALQGLKHGKMAEQSERLLTELRMSGVLRNTLGQRLKRGEHIPGFGHRLYPDGDPRGRLLLDLVQQTDPDHAINAMIAELERVTYDLIGEKPTLDLGLAAVTHVLGLAEGMSLVLFALGRTIGWIGHALEQSSTDQLIRPRARYVGVPPQTDDH